MTDGNGSVSINYAYDAFGNQESGQENDNNPFRYSGEYFDSETGFIYLRARYYNTEAGRFTTEDPAQDGVNWFVYCSNNPLNFRDPSGMWMEGDENLSQGAQTYTKYYGEKWEQANEKYNNATTTLGKLAAKTEMAQWHAKAENIRSLDAQNKVTGSVLNVPVFNQYDTAPFFYNNNLCWATSQSMILASYLGDTEDRTWNIASYTHYIYGDETEHSVYLYNQGRRWHSTNEYQAIIEEDISSIEQTQFQYKLTEEEIADLIEAGDPFGVLYGEYDAKKEWYGHWIVGIGYASAPGHETLVVSNDPAGGVQRIQSYTEFQIYVGDPVPWRKWANTAFRLSNSGDA